MPLAPPHDCHLPPGSVSDTVSIPLYSPCPPPSLSLCLPIEGPLASPKRFPQGLFLGPLVWDSSFPFPPLRPYLIDSELPQKEVCKEIPGALPLLVCRVIRRKQLEKLSLDPSQLPHGHKGVQAHLVDAVWEQDLFTCSVINSASLEATTQCRMHQSPRSVVFTSADITAGPAHLAEPARRPPLRLLLLDVGYDALRGRIHLMQQVASRHRLADGCD